MKRIIFSIIGGILFPLVYTFSAAAVCFLFPRYDLAGDQAPGLIFAPIAIPIHILIYFDLPEKHYVLGTIGIVVFNIALYSFLTYLLFRWLGFFEPAKTENYQLSHPPPPPPRF
jgi:hypothetical protein